MMIYACGPEGMLAATAKAAARHGRPCQVSVERVMGCGLGGCYGCVVPMRDERFITFSNTGDYDKADGEARFSPNTYEQYRMIFLRTQRDDLVQAIESLRGTIRKINLTSRELFREAFAAVNVYFGEIFTSLFGGGTAKMQLLDEEDILESGIELAAQPPGKKNQSIALLSGGERALTALALLFAIFRYKPSPFCILDEVDAPLDEINNERFVRLVRDMSRDTQFIVITHSRRTMEAADILYGVTMEEAGCSRLVSVNFAEVEG